jgi:N-formylglutamate amidohydrolase
MSAVGAPTHPDPGQERADFCIGNINGQTCSPEALEFVRSLIEGLGYSCSVNFPYVGAELNARHGAPAAGVESIFIEINKKLFMDTKTFRKTEGFARVQQGATHILQQLAARARKQITA